MTTKLGLAVYGNALLVGVGLDPNIANSNNADVTTLNASSGGNLFGKTQTFPTSFASGGLGTHAPDTLIDLWRVTGTTGTDNLIQFRVNTLSSVPEPTSSLTLAGVFGLALLARRKRG